MFNPPGYDIRNAKKADAGRIVSDVLLKIMDDIGCPDGISSLGYSKEDIPALVKVWTAIVFSTVSIYTIA